MNFQDCMELLYELEGWDSNDPDDPGGRTRAGITADTYARFLGRRPTNADWSKLTRERIELIYESYYWDALYCGALPVGVRLVVFDTGVNQGVNRAATWLQTAVGAKVDGYVGPKTVAAVKAKDPYELIIELSARRTVHWSGLINLVKFHFGWFRRGYRVAVQSALNVEEATR